MTAGAAHEPTGDAGPPGPGAAAGQGLTWDVTPKEVEYSPSPDRLSVVTLTVSATNRTGAAITTPGATIAVPWGTGQQTLTADPSTIGAAPGPSTPWAIAVAGDGEWRAMPLPPATGVAAGASVGFVLTDVVVNDSPGPVELTVADGAGGTTTVLTVTKTTPASRGSTPRITSFTATPERVALAGVVTVAWAVTDAVSCVLRPGPVPLPDPVAGSLPLAAARTTTYQLEAIGTGGRATAAATVTVMPVAIRSFTATPATPVARGTQVTLRWATDFASDAAVDQGVGSVPTSGSAVVRPDATTVYTLTAGGLQPQSASVTVPVT